MKLPGATRERTRLPVCASRTSSPPPSPVTIPAWPFSSPHLSPRSATRPSPRLPLGACVLPLTALGCGLRTETFDIKVHNATTQPVTITLAKDAPHPHIPGPGELDWAAPEDLASDSALERQAGRPPAVPPGHDAFVRHLKGTFDAYTHGTLRCYWGDVTISQMVSRGPGSPDRVDVPLAAGRNDVTVVEKGGRLAAEVELDVPVGKGR